MSGQRLRPTRDTTWLRGCARVGVDVQLHGRPSVHPEGDGKILIGDRCTVSSQPVATHFVAGPGAVLDIRQDVAIGHGSAIAAYERVEIGEGTLIGPFAIIMDTNFHGNTGDQSVHHDCRPVIIGRNCRIGSRVTITRGATIGDGAEVLAGSVVSSAIPAGACAAGARARVLGTIEEAARRWDSAAAVLPLLVMDCMRLDAPVNLAGRPADLADWSTTAADCVRRSVATRFGLELNASDFYEASSFAELASSIDAARRDGVSGRR